LADPGAIWRRQCNVYVHARARIREHTCTRVYMRIHEHYTRTMYICAFIEIFIDPGIKMRYN